MEPCSTASAPPEPREEVLTKVQLVTMSSTCAVGTGVVPDRAGRAESWSVASKAEIGVMRAMLPSWDVDAFAKYELRKTSEAEACAVGLDDQEVW